MNDERLDRMLSAAGERWRDAQPPAPEVDQAALTEPRRPGWMAPVAAAAAVAVVIGGGTLLLSDRDGTRGNNDPAPADTRSAVPDDFVVPFAQLDATHPKWPAPVVTEVPDRKLTEGRPVCRAEELTAKGSVEGATGTMYDFVTLSAAGPDVKCRLPARVRVGYSGPTGGGPVGAEELLRFVDAEPSGPDGRVWPYDVPVDPEHPAMLTMSWTSMWCVEPIDIDTLTLGWGSGNDAEGLVVPGFGNSPACNGDPGSDEAAPIRVFGLAPVDFRIEGVPRPIDDLQVRQVSFSQESEYGPGTAIVDLVSEQDAPLSPCPDARLSIRNSRDDVTEMDYALNCGAVPWKQTDGTPYLPAGRHVRFEVPIPEWGDLALPTYRWTLMSPSPKTIDLSRDAVEPQVMEREADGNFLLDVSNQSFDKPVIPIKVWIDDVLLIDNAFHVDGQHTWVTYPIRLSQGYHLIRVEAADGTESQAKLVIARGKVLYANTEYWRDDSGAPYLTWRTQASPFFYD
jgi:hypothetical protein